METKEFKKKYNIERHNTDCVKWDSHLEHEDDISMWIADMDFKLPDKFNQALANRMLHGNFGYTMLPADYYDKMIQWNLKRNNLQINKDWVRFASGAVTGLCQLIYILTKENDGIMINTPVYHPFKNSILGCKRKPVISKLINNNGYFTMNYKDIESKIIKNDVKMFIFCTPHNPIGRVWTKKEIETLLAICKKHNVIVVSDQVHSDLIMEGHKFVPTLSFKKYQNIVIALDAVSKSFSVPAFAHTHVIIPNKKIRDKFDAYQAAHHISVNAISALPTYYGYQYCEEWMDDVVKVIKENYDYLVNRLKNYCTFCPMEGTYLVFADFKDNTKGKTAEMFLKEDCHIIVNAGEIFGKGYESWARINIATPMENVVEACNRIEKAIKGIK